jgi:hypothetical protein
MRQSRQPSFAGFSQPRPERWGYEILRTQGDKMALNLQSTHRGTVDVELPAAIISAHQYRVDVHTCS